MSPSKRALQVFLIRKPIGEYDIDVGTENDTTLTVHNIEVFDRGRGIGSTVMKLLCQIADDHDVVLELEVGPKSAEEVEGVGDVLDGHALVEWYFKFGFEWDDDFSFMRRQPNTINPYMRF